MSAMHTESIQFYILLMRAYFYGGDIQKADQYFSKSIAVLEFNWGPQHPYQIVMFTILANLYVEANIADSAMHLY